MQLCHKPVALEAAIALIQQKPPNVLDEDGKWSLEARLNENEGHLNQSSTIALRIVKSCHLRRTKSYDLSSGGAGPRTILNDAFSANSQSVWSFHGTINSKVFKPLISIIGRHILILLAWGTSNLWLFKLTFTSIKPSIFPIIAHVSHQSFNSSRLNFGLVLSLLNMLNTLSQSIRIDWTTFNRWGRMARAKWRISPGS